VADVVDALSLAQKEGLEVAVRGGGHNVAGRAVCDNGVVIDLTPMKGMHVDVKSQRVHVQGGVTWGEFNRETQLHGLATTGGVVSSTGVAGLTLGGGLGYLMGKYGMAVDNLRSAEVVTAAGSVVHASESENAELFWGIRGGGGNFGVVTSFEFELYPVGPTIIGGLMIYPFEEARQVLTAYRDFTAGNLEDELTVFAGLVHAPDGSGIPLAAIFACHCGSLEEGEAAVAPLKQFGTPVMDELGPMPYTALNGMLDAGFPKGALNYWKSNFLTELTDEAIDIMVERFAGCPSVMTGVVLEHFHGAATRVGTAETAFSHRSEGYNLLVASEWMEPGDTDRNIEWTRETYGALENFMGGGSYVNYLADDESLDRVKNAYGENYARLERLKREMDPGNVFHLNQNIIP
jgi:FAD/FMN-containing dehydrogenase